MARKAALRSDGPDAARAAKTVAARDAGVVLGLLVLTPVLVNQLHKAPNQALPAATCDLKLSLAPCLVAAYKNASQIELLDFGPTFAQASAPATPHGVRLCATSIASSFRLSSAPHKRVLAPAPLRRHLRDGRPAADGLRLISSKGTG
jgi:hypothetical protein